MEMSALLSHFHRLFFQLSPCVVAWEISVVVVRILSAQMNAEVLYKG